MNKKKDLIIIKYYYFAFEQIALLKTLRINLIINYIYLYDSLTDMNIYFIAADVIRYELYITIVEDYLEFRSVEEYEEVKRQIIDIISVNKIKYKEIIMKSEG